MRAGRRCDALEHHCGGYSDARRRSTRPGDERLKSSQQPCGGTHGRAEQGPEQTGWRCDSVAPTVIIIAIVVDIVKARERCVILCDIAASHHELGVCRRIDIRHEHGRGGGQHTEHARNQCQHGGEHQDLPPWLPIPAGDCGACPRFHQTFASLGSFD